MADYDKLTVVKLREELVKRGLPKTGLKAALVQRLVEADAQSEQDVPIEDEQNTSSHPETRPDVKDSLAAPENVPEPSKSQSQLEPKDNDEPSRSLPDAVKEVERSESNTGEPNNGVSDESTAGSYQATISGKTSAEIVGLNEDGQRHENITRDTNVIDEASPTALELAGHSAQQEELTPATTRASDARVSPPAIPAISTQTSTVGREEIREDTNKRKRRSQTPPPSSIETAQKRAKADDGRPHVKLPEDETNNSALPVQPNPEPADSTMLDGPAVTMPGEALEEPTVNGHAPKHANTESIETFQTTQGELEATEVPTKSVVPDNEEHVREMEIEQPPAQDMKVGSPAKHSPSDTRFKNLFTGPPKREGSPDRQKIYNDNEDRVISPALHPATSALYIRDLLRPIKAETLKEYLSTLATPPDTEMDPTIITEFFLDNVKTHCLVAFANTSAAARVRLGLHDRVWPDEKNRKPLWVDFVPEEKLPKWIEVETEAASDRRQGMKKWEVIYEEEQGGVTAFLQEAGPSSSAPRAVQPMIPRKESVAGTHRALSIPKGRDEPPSTSQIGPTVKSDAGKGFQALDELFKVTAAKPKLYYLPVSQEIVDRRLDRLAAGRGGGKSDEKRRYTFEDEVVTAGEGVEDTGVFKAGEEATEGITGEAVGEGK
ncbi:hypothetical protein G7Y79_00002g005150 [Physcia stellaris]|nr:hypothetical protein G7Y79_00002g005150 [Physcia stellaris]